MTVIKTNRNRVVIDDPEPDDTHVQVVWQGPPQDGPYRVLFEGPLLPIERQDEAVAWARSMADFMLYPIYVMPMTGREALRTEQMNGAFANLTDQQRGQLLHKVVAMLTRLLRDSDDAAIRASAYDVLFDMGVGR